MESCGHNGIPDKLVPLEMVLLSGVLGSKVRRSEVKSRAGLCAGQ